MLEIIINEFLFLQHEIFKSGRGVIQAVTTKCSFTGAEFDLREAPGVSYKPIFLIEDAFSLPRNSIVISRQTHSSKIEIATSRNKNTNFICDALITSEPNIFVMGQSSDCPIITLYDPKTVVCAEIHASWRSTLAGIISKTFDIINSKFGSEPKNFLAAIAPCIGKCCYEVKNDFIELFRAVFPFTDEYLTKKIIKKEKKYFFDLSGCITKILETIGVLAKNIENADICNKCRSDLFFSYRLNGVTAGRYGSFIGAVS